MRLKTLILLAVLATGLPLSAQTAVGPCKMDGSDCATGGGGSGDVTGVTVTGTAPVTVSGSPCTTGDCSFTLGLTGGVLSGLTTGRILQATGAAAAGDTDISYHVGKFDSSEPVNGRKLCLTDSQSPPNVYCLVTSDGSRYGGLVVTRGSAEGASRADIGAANVGATSGVLANNQISAGGTALWAAGFLGQATLQLPGTTGEIIWNDRDAPDTQLVRDAAGQLGVYGAGSSYGQLNVGTIQLVDTGTKPTCDAAHRGQVWYDAGGAGVADTYEICRKDAADAYAWTALY